MESTNTADLSVPDLFEKFIETTTMRNVLSIHHKILELTELEPCEFNQFFPRFKRAIISSRQKKSWKAKALFSKIEKRAAQKCYSNTKATNPINMRTCDTNANQEIYIDESQASRSGSLSFSNNHVLLNYNCLVIGSGPAGLRTAIELQLLGASRVVVVEKRGRFSRNNVLHLWPFVIDDLKSLGAKKFYGKFCAGSIDHISIRQLQLMLLKVCLMIGCDFRESCSYISLCPSNILQQHQNNVCNYSDSVKSSHQECEPNIWDDEECSSGQKIGDSIHDIKSISSLVKSTEETSSDLKPNPADCMNQVRSAAVKNARTTSANLKGTRAHFQCDQKSQEPELHSISWDIIIGADGRRNTLSDFFPRREFRGRLAIAITANFINRQTPAESSIPEISGISYIYNQDMFNALAYDTNIELENICYYKDDTHYFVMTAKKRSLLERGVLINDYTATQDLLSSSNVNKEKLLQYAKDAATWTTGLKPLDFALNHYGQEDCAMFDFTSMYAASNACKALRTDQGGLTLVGLVGDSLLEPFWPTGSGCARGFLSSFDAAWMCRQWAINKCAVIKFQATTNLKTGKNRQTKTDRDKNLPSTYDKMALSVIAERESIYRILAQTKSENLQHNYSHWTLNPHTRYPNLNRHLISPAQVTHLLGNSPLNSILEKAGKYSNPLMEHSRRIKSPNTLKSRRSPKKLKSAEASPVARCRNMRNRSKHNTKSRSRYDISIDDEYLDFEDSYKDLADGDKGVMNQYLSYKQRSADDLDELSRPSLSGTMPSSSNLSKLEARKVRDIDECLRQRRQKAKITIVRDKLMSQMRNELERDCEFKCPLKTGGNAVLFSEIKRLREQQCNVKRGESLSRDLAGPLAVLNSIRRCASFAERVKSFESKLSNQDSVESTVSTPKTPIDNVKNLPQFVTLQELIINGSQLGDKEQVKKSRLPITKLTKDDWNVKCWEKRLVSHKQRSLSASSKYSGNNISMDTDNELVSLFNKPKKQIDIFQDRINQMANKLNINNENKWQTKVVAHQVKPDSNDSSITKSTLNRQVRSQGWINHLKRELAKGSECERRTMPAMNPVQPGKTIKKLFEDDDDEQDGIDVNKHYDHLCINRPTNKYLSKGVYKSHLARPSINGARTVNKANSSCDSKKAYLPDMETRVSSSSSNLSNCSTKFAHQSSGSSYKSSPMKSSHIDVECLRCKKFVTSSERITIGSSSLHRACLSCAGCSLTLRPTEIQHYLKISCTGVLEQFQSAKAEFLCTICKPEIRDNLVCGVNQQDESLMMKSLIESENIISSSNQSNHQNLKRSRENFLNSCINYTELYKNLIKNDSARKATLYATELRSNELESKVDEQQMQRNVSPSPVQVTLPMRLIMKENELVEDNQVSNLENILDENTNFGVTDCYSAGENEQVTLILPDCESRLSSTEDQVVTSSVRRESKENGMIDEEELERILHLDSARLLKRASLTSEQGVVNQYDEDTSSTSTDEVDKNYNGRSNTTSSSSIDRQHSNIVHPEVKGSTQYGIDLTSDDDSSSLDVPQDTDSSDTEENLKINLQSTCEGSISTSDEYEAVSDGDEEEEKSASHQTSYRNNPTERSESVGDC